MNVNITLTVLVAVLAVWVGGCYYMSKRVRRVVWSCLVAGAAALFACTVSEWRAHLLAAAVMVFSCIVWEFAPRYYHGRRRAVNKERREKLPFWEDLSAFASIGIAAMAALSLI